MFHNMALARLRSKSDWDYTDASRQLPDPKETFMAQGYPKIVFTEEVMREGMQIESASIPSEDKVELLNALSDTGLQNIVVGSFVSPKYTPQMKNIENVLINFNPRPASIIWR